MSQNQDPNAADHDARTDGDDDLSRTMLAALAASSAKSLGAPQLARVLMPTGDAHSLLGAIRKAAVRLARDGRLVIYRKGKPADPDNFKGTYRLGLPGRGSEG